MGQLEVDLIKKMIKIERCFAFEELFNKSNSSFKKSNKSYYNKKNSVNFPTNNYDITNTLVIILSP
jgi:hypothetical protein